MCQKLLLFFVGVGYVSGYGHFRSEIPNGFDVTHPCDDKEIWIGVGHQKEGGGGDRNPFGLDFSLMGFKWTDELCWKDSDGDGQTNGQELGDPDCTWTKGATPMRTDEITHPGICTPIDSAVCKDKNDWFDCKSDKLDCPAFRAPGVQNKTMRLPKTKVPAEETTYMCMIFDLPYDQDYHMIGYTPEIDNVNVMHHILIYGCTDTDEEIPTEPYKCGMDPGHKCNEVIGIWAVGSPGNCFSDSFGLKFGLSEYKRIALEFHWNNPGMESTWDDSSGMTIYYTSQLRPNNGAILTLGQNYLAIPPGRDSVTFNSTCTSECTSSAMNASIYVTEAFNHMHYLGHAQSVVHKRNGQMLRYITNDPEYSYDDPVGHSYDPPVEVRQGDEFFTTCKFTSKYSKNWVYYGDATQDEMCFAFLFFYPKEAMPENYCINWKSIPICAARSRPLTVNQCQIYTFIGLYDPVGNEKMMAVNKYCKLDGHCTDECKNAIMSAKEHPCLRGGDVTSYIANRFRRTKEGLEFLIRMKMCDIKKEDHSPSTGSSSLPLYTLIVVSVTMVFKLL